MRVHTKKYQQFVSTYRRPTWVATLKCHARMQTPVQTKYISSRGVFICYKSDACVMCIDLHSEILLRNTGMVMYEA